MKTLITLIAILLASPVWAQVSTVVPIMDDRSHEPHDYSFGPVSVPLGADSARVVIDSKDRLKGNGTMTVVLKLSLNGGVTQQPAGGAVFDATKQPQDFTVALLEPGNSGRVLEGRITLYGRDRWKGAAWIEID